MAGKRTLHTTLMLALAADSAGGLAPSSDVPLPPPRAYATTWSLWFVLGIVSGFGAAAERLAGQLSVLVLLTKLMLSTAGPHLLGGLERVARLFPAQPAAPAAAPAAPTTA